MLLSEANIDKIYGISVLDKITRNKYNVICVHKNNGYFDNKDIIALRYHTVNKDIIIPHKEAFNFIVDFSGITKASRHDIATIFGGDRNFRLKEYAEIQNELQGAEIIISMINDYGYEEDALILYEKSNKLFIVEASHCSCNEFFGKWDPQEYSYEALKKRKFGGNKYLQLYIEEITKERNL